MSKSYKVEVPYIVYTTVHVECAEDVDDAIDQALGKSKLDSFVGNGYGKLIGPRGVCSMEFIECPDHNADGFEGKLEAQVIGVD